MQLVGDREHRLDVESRNGIVAGGAPLTFEVQAEMRTALGGRDAQRPIRVDGEAVGYRGVVDLQLLVVTVQVAGSQGAWAASAVIASTVGWLFLRVVLR